MPGLGLNFYYAIALDGIAFAMFSISFSTVDEDKRGCLNDNTRCPATTRSLISHNNPAIIRIH